MAGFKIALEGVEELENRLNQLNSVRWEAVRKKQTAQMLNRQGSLEEPRYPQKKPGQKGRMENSDNHQAVLEKKSGIPRNTARMWNTDIEP